MSQFILALAAALAILTSINAATAHNGSQRPVTVTPADVIMPDPV